MIVFTAAPPKWPGIHHVNCQDHPYWIKEFALRGFLYDPRLTKACRDASTMNIKRPFRKQFIKQRCLFMFNTKYLDEIKFEINAGNKLSDDSYDINTEYVFDSLPVKITLPKVPNYNFETKLPLSSIIERDLQNLLNYSIIQSNKSLEFICHSQNDYDTLSKYVDKEKIILV